MDATRIELFETLARLLEYPGGTANPGGDVIDMRSLLAATGDAAAATGFEAFATAFGALSADRREELFTRTFDINPVCSLEVGWHIFGETYDRGGMLVKLRGLMRERGVAESVELPDHLTQTLRLFVHLDDKRARDLAVGFIEPAVRKMRDAFDDDGNPYLALLTTVATLVETTRAAHDEVLQDA